MPLTILVNDITKMETDAIVNAANEDLYPGGGVCGAIFHAAGYQKLAKACSDIGHCDTGDAVITGGFALKAKYIIHTPGPVYSPFAYGCGKKLYSCYMSSLELAKKYRLRSVAFPLISSGIYGYPKREAMDIARRAITDFLAENEMNVYLVLFDKSIFEPDNELVSEVSRYIDEKMTAERAAQESRYIEMYETESFGLPKASYPCASPRPNLDAMLKSMDSSFSEYLFMLIDRSGKTDVEVYKRANVDRKLFSKIRNKRGYKPKKPTAVAFALALELDMEELTELVGRAGYSMTHSSKFDIIIEYFVTRGIYDVFEINEVLLTFDQPLIGV